MPLASTGGLQLPQGLAASIVLLPEALGGSALHTCQAEDRYFLAATRLFALHCCCSAPILQPCTQLLHCMLNVQLFAVLPQVAAPSRPPFSLSSLQAWQQRRPSRALILARSSTTAQGSSTTTTTKGAGTEPSCEEQGSKAASLGTAPSSTPVQPQQLATSKGSILEWELADGMAAAPGTASMPGEAAATGSSSSSSSRLARLVPSSLASLLGLGSSASDAAAGSSSGSSSSSPDIAEEEASQGPSAGPLPGTTVGYLEGKTALFEGGRQVQVDVLEAWSAGDGMAADIADARQRDAAQQQPSLYQVPAAAKAAAAAPTPGTESKAPKQQQQLLLRVAPSARRSKVALQGASEPDPPAAEAPSWDHEEFGQLLQALEGARLQAAGAVSSTVQQLPLQQLESSRISHAALAAEGAMVAGEAAESREQMGPNAAPVSVSSLEQPAASTPAAVLSTGLLPAEGLQAGDSCSSEEGPGAVLALLRQRVVEGSLPGARQFS